MLRLYQVGCIALGRRAPAFGDFGPNTSARHQHLRREGANGAQRAENGQPKQGEQYGSDRRLTQRPDEQSQHRTASRRPTDRGEDNSHIERK